jgi:hypothetical protein
MPSPQLLKQLEHFNEVRRLMAAAGFAEPGQDVPRLTADEVREQELGHRVGVSPRDVADVLIARRSEHLAAAVADGYVVESDECGDPRVVDYAVAGAR